METERLEAVFTSNTTQALRAARELDAAHTTLDKNLTKAKGLDKLTADSKKAGDSATKTGKGLKDLSASTVKVEHDSDKASRKIRGMAGEMDHAKKAGSGLFATLKNGFSMGGGGIFGTSGGIIPGLANISSIIRGIPQIGQLAHAIVSPLTDAAEEGVRLNMRLEQAEIGFTAVAGSADKAHEHLMKLQAFGVKSPFRFEGLLDASQLMTTFGFDLKDQIPLLTTWGNAIASSGDLSAENVRSVVTAFGQMRMAGRLNAQDMNQLTSANIPGWELLAKAMGKTVAVTRKLSEEGKLNGEAAVEAITAMMAQELRFKGRMGELQKTTAGRLSAALDTIQIAQGTAMQGTTANFGKLLQDFLDNPDLLPNLSARINSVLTPISGLIETGVKTILGGGITTGLVDGLQFGKDAVKKAVIDMAGDSIIGSFKSMLGIGSPSTVFIGFGINSAEGYRDGILSGLNTVSGEIMGGFNDVLDQVEALMQSRNKRLLVNQEKAKSNLERLTQREPDFLQKLISGSRTRGINPDHLLNVMAVETAGSFNPAAKNPTSSASGLIQFMADTALKLGTTTAELRRMSATSQLDYVFKYFDDFLRRGKDLSTQGALYAAVGAGKVGANDDAVLMRRGQRGYAGNAPTWDRNMDGFIRQGEMAFAAVAKLGAGVNFTVNGQAVTATNPVPVVFASVPGSAGLSDRLGGWQNTPKRVSRTQTAGPSAPPPDLSGNVFSGPQLLEQVDTDSSKIKVTVRELLPMFSEIEGYLKNSSADATIIEKALKGPGDYRAMVMALGTVQGQLQSIRDQLISTGDLFTQIFVSFPESVGGIFGDALNQADGSIQGFLSGLRQNFLTTFQQIAADIVRNQITRATGELLQGLVGSPVLDDKNKPTGEISGGVSWVRSILGFLGVDVGGKSGADAIENTATNANTTATLANTVALTSLATAMTANSIAGAAGGGGRGILGSIFSAVISGVLGGIGGGFGGGGPGGPFGLGPLGSHPPTFGSGGPFGLGPLGSRASGGPVTAGLPYMVHQDELIVPGGDAHVFNKQQTAQMLSGGSGRGGGHFTLNLTQVIHAPNGRVAPESAEQAAMKTVAAVSRFTQQRGGNI